VDQHLEPVIGTAAESAEHHEQGRTRRVVRDLATADLIQPGDLVEEFGDLRPAVLGEQLHQRARQLFGCDRQLLERALDRRLGRRAHGEGADDFDAIALVEIEEGGSKQGRVEVLTRRERPGDLVVHLRRAGEGRQVGTARQDGGVGGERPVDLAAVELKELCQNDVRQVAQMGFDKEPFESLVKMQIFKVTPEFVTEVRNEGLTDLKVEDVVKLRIFKIDAEFIRQAKAEGVPLEVERLVQRKIGVARR